MAVSLDITNFFDLTGYGPERTGKQGLLADVPTTVYSLTASTVPIIAGPNHNRSGVLATATVVTLYNSANDFPATWDYLHYWADVKTYIELITSATSVVIAVAANVPFVMPGFGTMLGTAGTSLITGGSEPAVTAIAKVVIGNYSGGNANYALTIVD